MNTDRSTEQMSSRGRLRFHLLYHEVQAQPGEYRYALSTAHFREHVALAAGDAESASALPVITLDDGHETNYSQALPVLQQAGVAAHFFLTAGWIGTRRNYMTPAEVRALAAAGQQIGAHGWSHKLLTHCSAAELDEELVRSRASLQDMLGVPVTMMSLPGGRFDRRVLAACEAAGYKHVYTSKPQLETLPLPYCIGRFNIAAGTPVEAVRALLQPRSPQLAHLRRTERLKSFARATLGDAAYARLWQALNRSHAEDVEDRGMLV